MNKETPINNPVSLNGKNETPAIQTINKPINANTKKIIIGVVAFVGLLLIVGVIAILSNSSSNGVKNNVGTNSNTSGTVTQNETGQNIGFVANDNPSCSLPVVEYKSNAFSIGVPKGWIYNVAYGTVSIMQDESNTTAAFLYSAKLKKEVSSTEFLNQLAYVFNKTIENVGGTFSMNTPTVTTNGASADITATVGEALKGKMTVERSGDFMILRAYWAPVGDYTAQEPQLKEIVGCFARTKILTDEILLSAHDDSGTLIGEVESGVLKEYTGRYFKLNKPDNFKVDAETDSGIDLTRTDGNAGFSFSYATGFTGSYTPRSWALKALPQYAKITNLSLGEGQSVEAAIKGQTIQAFNFTGSLGSTSVKGKATVGIYSTPYTGIGDQYTSAFWGIEIATPAVWDGVKSTLQAMQDSLTIIDIGATRKNTLLPANRPIESVSATKITGNSSYSETAEKLSGENWDDAMRGYETVVSPTTGDRMDVPLNSWSSYGPQGPGYYHEISGGNSLEKLELTD